MLEVEASLAELFEVVAKLLAHPLQRSKQPASKQTEVDENFFEK